MKMMDSRMGFWVLLPALIAGVLASAGGTATESDYLAPSSAVLSADGQKLYIAESAVKQIAVLDIASETVCCTVSLPAEPTGMTLLPGGETLLVTCADSAGTLCWIRTEDLKIVKKVKAGMGACSPVVRADGKRAYVCNRFENDISTFDLETYKEIGRIPARREPISATLTPDGKYLFVANHLPLGPADVDVVASSVCAIDTAGLACVAEIELPNGSSSLKDICISEDGRYVFVSHILSRFHLPTTQLERGWMNTNALTLIDVSTLKAINTVLLDDIDRGAANPWAVACTADGKYICVTHAGTHELSLIDRAALFEKLESLPKYPGAVQPSDYTTPTTTVDDVPNDLTFLVGLRRRIPLEGKGPREVIVADGKAYVLNYFSDNLNTIELAMEGRVKMKTTALGPEPKIDTVRQGEIFFFDASLCFQTWQSCTSCHPDVRADGLNWDLLNDGIGNPKNTKSMLYSHMTPPAMSTGIRGSAETAVRAGIRHIQFVERPEADAVAIDEFLKSLRPVPSPFLKRGKLSASAKRGKKLFFSEAVGCAGCHNGEYYTNLSSYDVGTKSRLDRDGMFDTPMLIELWRTGPYLHDGRSVTLRQVLTTDNPHDQHGVTSQLSEQEIADLEAFLLSL